MTQYQSEISKKLLFWREKKAPAGMLRPNTGLFWRKKAPAGTAPGAPYFQRRSSMFGEQDLLFPQKKTLLFSRKNLLFSQKKNLLFSQKKNLLFSENNI